MIHTLLKYTNYRELSKWYDDKYIEMGDGWDCPRDVALEYLNFAGIEKSEKLLLDVGCGAGHFLSVAEEFVNCEGIDISDVALNKARERLKHSIVYKLNIEKMDSWSVYDYVTSIGSIEHCIKINEAVKVIYRVLKKEGYFFALVPNDKWEHFDQPNETTKSHLGWKNLFIENKFKVIKEKIDNNLSYFLLKK